MILALSSSIDGIVANLLISAVERTPVPIAPPTTINFSLFLENSTQALQAEIGSLANAIAVGPLNKSVKASNFVPLRARRVIRFLVTLKPAPAFLILSLNSETSLTVRPLLLEKTVEDLYFERKKLYEAYDYQDQRIMA